MFNKNFCLCCRLHQLEEQEERRKNQMDTSDKAGMVIDTVVCILEPGTGGWFVWS
jgi:hypothetical protein